MSKEFINSVFRKWLGSEIRHTFLGGKIVHSDGLSIDKLTNKMVVNFNAFNPIMKGGIVLMHKHYA